MARRVWVRMSRAAALDLQRAARAVAVGGVVPSHVGPHRPVSTRSDPMRMRNLAALSAAAVLAVGTMALSGCQDNDTSGRNTRSDSGTTYDQSGTAGSRTSPTGAGNSGGMRDTRNPSDTGGTGASDTSGGATGGR
jgi:hypothetical protein